MTIDLASLSAELRRMQELGFTGISLTIEDYAALIAMAERAEALEAARRSGTLLISELQGKVCAQAEEIARLRAGSEFDRGVRAAYTAVHSINGEITGSSALDAILALLPTVAPSGDREAVDDLDAEAFAKLKAQLAAENDPDRKRRIISSIAAPPTAPRHKSLSELQTELSDVERQISEATSWGAGLAALDEWRRDLKREIAALDRARAGSEADHA